MSSSVFYRFKSQKEPKRIAFDGTGISVFELKREIIIDSKLGDGANFELILSKSDSNEEYDDDTTIIPRSSTVIAKRLPAARHGKGGAARYLLGKMPIHAKNTHRTEASFKPGAAGTAKSTAAMPPAVGDGQSEEERMAAILQLGSDQWTQQKQEMASATPVFRPGGKGKPANVPDKPLPPGYVCYRCGQKGHWIQECPTNDDPNWETQRRLKRTTGIPKSFLKTVEKPADAGEGNAEAPSGVMLNGEGEWVVVEPDKASWEQFQAKANKSAAAQQQADVGEKEIRERGLECPIDKRLFLEPTKTPCCQTTFCKDCITNALLDSDLQCPHCGKEVLVDNLEPDTDMSAKIREFQDEKAVRAKSASVEPSTVKAEAADSPTKPSNDEVAGASTSRPGSSSSKLSNKQEDEKAEELEEPKEDSKKRKAEDELENNRKSPMPNVSVAMEKSSSAEGQDAKTAPSFLPPELEMMNQMQFPNAGAMPNANAFMGPGMNMNMNPMMMANPMFTQMMMQMQMQNNMQNNMGGMNYNWGGQNNMGYPQQAPGFNNNSNNNNNLQINGKPVPTGPRFQNQQRPNVNNGGEESAYFRQPLNQRRGAARRNFQRPPNFRDV